MSDIFQEVEEEVRKERWEKLWKKYGNHAIAVAVLIVLAVGGYRGWQTYQHYLSEKASDEYQAALALAESGNLVAAESAFSKLAADAPSGYATLSKFALAAVFMNENKRDAAITTLRELTETDDAVLADGARFQLGWLIADAAPKAEIQATLAPLLRPDNPWRFAAADLLAYVALRTGARDEAIAAYDKLGKESGAPNGIRERAAAIAEYLRANPDVKTLPLAAPPPTLPSIPVQAPRGAPAGSAPAPSASAPGPAPAGPVSTPIPAAPATPPAPGPATP